MDAERVQERCQTCRFWRCLYTERWPKFALKLVERSENCLPSGECRRYPPVGGTVTGDNDDQSGDFPATCHDEWCGEWQRKEGE